MTSQVLSVIEGVFATSKTTSLTKATFLTYILPPFAFQYLMGVLVQLEGTRTYRMALLPITVYLAWRATFVDMSGGDPSKSQIDALLTTQMCILVTRSIVWAFVRARYQRHGPEDNRKKSGSNDVCVACWNTWDLILNVRGIGWNWSRGLFVPKPIFKTDSRVIFVLWMATALAFHAVALDGCVQIIRISCPGLLEGGSLFDHTLPPVPELLRAILVSFLTSASIYFGLQCNYHIMAIVCVTLFRQHPSHWPPLFDIPVLATSLSELWGRRWHQMMRDSVLTLGFQPLNRLFGRSGGLLGAFLIPWVFHNIDLGQRGYTVVCLSFWAMNGVGIILERLWKKATGRSVGGIWGRIWGAVWLAIWGIPMVDAYAKVGRLGKLNMAGPLQPSLALVALVRKVLDMAGF